MARITQTGPALYRPGIAKEVQLIEWLLMASWQGNRDTVTELMLKENFDGSRGNTPL